MNDKQDDIVDAEIVEDDLPPLPPKWSQPLTDVDSNVTYQPSQQWSPPSTDDGEEPEWWESRPSRDYTPADGSGLTYKTFGPVTLSALQAENIRSQAKHGLDKTNMSPVTSNAAKLVNLGEELGEVNELFTYDKMPALDAHPDIWIAWKDKLVRELLQVANLSLQWAQLADENPLAVIRRPV